MDTYTVVKEIDIAPEREGLYFEVPFDMPEGAARLDVRYAYERRVREETARGVKSVEQNIIDLALTAPGGGYIGSSGSDRAHIWVSEYDASPGYARAALTPGTWGIIVGAYVVAPGGVHVRYELTFTMKERALYRGDLHMHTTGSDGNLTPEELAHTAVKNGLDFIFITDHNNYAHNDALPQRPDLTVLPGVEWTHFKGHACLLGVRRAFDGAFYTNTGEQTREKLRAARSKGAIVSINHPFGNSCAWQWGFDDLAFDCVELMNGGNSPEGNEACFAWWHEALVRGRRVNIVGGSDFHCADWARMVGVPTTCVYAMSRGASDLMQAIRAGNCYVALSPHAPTVEMTYGGCIMGEEAAFDGETALCARAQGLSRGDVLRLVSAVRTLEIASDGECELALHVAARGGDLFWRAEVWRGGQHPARLPVVVTNPIYQKQPE